MIISASRRTDIPAFYSKWFFNRLEEGYVYVRNPINKNLISKVSLLPEDVDCFVFWSKNPKTFIKDLSKLSDYKYYFQFTLNSYSKDMEPSVPQKQVIIDTFINLSETIGKEKVIWRYDPILLSDKYTIDYHIKYFQSLAERLHHYTEKCVISFIDIYKKCERNLKNTTVIRVSENDIIKLANELTKITAHYGLSLETCAEKIELGSLGIGHNRCIDNVLIERILQKKIDVPKDKNQRDECGCIASIDIGAYNTCRHGCLYCYATFNSKMVADNWNKHSDNSPLLFGEVGEKDRIIERKVNSIITDTLFG